MRHQCYTALVRWSSRARKTSNKLSGERLPIHRRRLNVRVFLSGQKLFYSPTYVESRWSYHKMKWRFSWNAYKNCFQTSLKLNRYVKNPHFWDYVLDQEAMFTTDLSLFLVRSEITRTQMVIRQRIRRRRSVTVFCNTSRLSKTTAIQKAFVLSFHIAFE